MKWLDSTFLPSLCSDIPVAMQSYRTVMQTHPFAEEVPLLVDNVRLVTSGNTHYLQDAAGMAVTAVSYTHLNYAAQREEGGELKNDRYEKRFDFCAVCTCFYRFLFSDFLEC